MKGKLGSLHNGRLQVGGVLDWSLDLILADSIRDTAKTYKLSKWRLTASSYWLFDVQERITIRLYPDSGKGYWEGTGHIASQTSRVMDTLIHAQIEIIGEGVLEGKDDH